MDNFKKFSDEKLSNRCTFFSSLKDKCIGGKDYLYVNNVCNTLKINRMDDYHDLHLETDILLLADGFDNFINTCLEHYGLDPCHYFRSSGLSWGAIIKLIKIKSEFISNMDMYSLRKNGMTGGICYIAKRFRKTNNMMILSQGNILHGQMKIIYMVG